MVATKKPYIVDREIISSKISEFGLENQTLLMDIALKAGKSHLKTVVENFGNFGISDEAKRLEFALQYAETIRR